MNDPERLLTRRDAGLLLGAALAGLAGPLRAQTAAMPRILVGFPAGGSTDVIARLTAQRLAEALGQPFVVENRTGEPASSASRHITMSCWSSALSRPWS